MASRPFKYKVKRVYLLVFCSMFKLTFFFSLNPFIENKTEIVK